MSATRFDPDETEYLAEFLTPRRKALFERVLAERTRHVCLVLEDVYQEHNASACLRSSDVFGVQDVHVVEDENEFRPDGEVALGASRWLTLKRYGRTTDCLRELRRRGYRVVATSPSDDATPIDEFDVSRPAALVFGSELPGISSEMAAAADETVRIPMYGFTESLNVSVSVALCLQHVARELRASSVDWRLSRDEREELFGEWVRTSLGPKRESFERRFEQDRAG